MSRIGDYSYHYRLYPYRQGIPRQRFATFYSEAQRCISTLAGYATLLSMQIQEMPATPEPQKQFQRELLQVITEIQGLPDSYKFPEISSDDLSHLRNQLLPLLDQLDSLTDFTAEVRQDLKQIWLESDWYWSTQFTNDVHMLTASVDILMNPDLRLPSFLIDWIAIEDRVRRQAIAKDPEALLPLLEALKNPVSAIRRDAAILLRHIKDIRAVEPLIALLEDEVDEVRAEAAEVLGMIGDRRAIEPLITCLLKYQQSRWGPIEALIQMPDRRAFAPLIQVLVEESQKASWVDNRNLRLGQSLRQAIEAIDGPEAAAAIEQYYKN